MDDTLGNNKALPWLEVDRPTFKIDDEVPLKNKEEFIIVLVFVPVVFALHDAKTDDGIVDSAKSLVIPAVCASFDELRDIPDTQPRELHIQMGGVWVVFGVLMEISFAALNQCLRKKNSSQRAMIRALNFEGLIASMKILSKNMGVSNLPNPSPVCRFTYSDSLPSEPLGHYVLSIFL